MHYFIFFTITLLFLNSNIVYAYNGYHTREYYSDSYFSPKEIDYNFNKNLKEIELYSFNKSFENENYITRIERLENFAFGTIQIGNLNNRYYNVRNTILNRPKENYKKTFIKALGDYFLGETTGITPNYQNFNNNRYNEYPSNFGKQSFGEYNSPYGKGYTQQNFARENSTRIQILD